MYLLFLIPWFTFRSEQSFLSRFFFSIFHNKSNLHVDGIMLRTSRQKLVHIATSFCPNDNTQLHQILWKVLTGNHLTNDLIISEVWCSLGSWHKPYLRCNLMRVLLPFWKGFFLLRGNKWCHFPFLRNQPLASWVHLPLWHVNIDTSTSPPSNSHGGQYRDERELSGERKRDNRICH